MNWINPVPNAGWYCNDTPVPVAIWFTQGVYVIGTGIETRYAPTGSTIEQAQQIGHDMVLQQTALVRQLLFRSFSLDLPTDGQNVYVIDSSNVISSGVYSISSQTVTPAGGASALNQVDLAGWSQSG